MIKTIENVVNIFIQLNDEDIIIYSKVKNSTSINAKKKFKVYKSEKEQVHS